MSDVLSEGNVLYTQPDILHRKMSDLIKSEDMTP